MSKIEWTDATWNPVTGCTRVSPGCANCYIERTPPFRKTGRRFERIGNESTTGVALHPDRLDQPLRWRRPRRVFVNSMSDLFHEDVPDSFIDQVFAIMALASTHTFQILTKRPERMWEYFQPPSTAVLAKSPDARVGRLAMELADARGEDIDHPFWDAWWAWPLPNVWLGVSVENQVWADQRIPLLVETPAAVRFLSIEPLLKPVDLGPWLTEMGPNDWPVKSRELQWVIIGGESGPKARAFNPDWVREIVYQCQTAGVAVFVKQLGSPWAKAAGARHRMGGDPDEWPEDLRVREWPAQTIFQTASA